MTHTMLFMWTSDPEGDSGTATFFCDTEDQISVRFDDFDIAWALDNAIRSQIVKAQRIARTNVFQQIEKMK